jgi:hypothetical protein
MRWATRSVGRRSGFGALTYRKAGPVGVGVNLNMLIPLPYEVAWTRVDDGYFNDYPAGFTDDAGNPVVPGGVLTSALSDTTEGQTVGIPASVSTAVAIMAANVNRGYLLIENNSSATATGDIAPTLYFAYDGPVPLPLILAKAIPPQSGLVLDRRVPANAIYVAWGPSVNTGGSVVQGGVIEQGLLPVE